MDVDDDDEYMNAAGAHAAFIMTVSAARMYWLGYYVMHIFVDFSQNFSERALHGGTPPFTDPVSWSVCMSVCWSVTDVSLGKRMNRSRFRLGCGLGWT